MTTVNLIVEYEYQRLIAFGLVIIHVWELLRIITKPFYHDEFDICSNTKTSKGDVTRVQQQICADELCFNTSTL